MPPNTSQPLAPHYVPGTGASAGSIIIVPFEHPHAPQERAAKRPRVEPERPIIPQTEVESYIRTLGERAASFSCRINNCGAQIATSGSDVQAHLEVSHGLKGRAAMPCVPSKGCPWPGCSGRKFDTTPMAKHILNVHGPKSRYQCVICGDVKVTHIDTMRRYVRAFSSTCLHGLCPGLLYS